MFLFAHIPDLRATRANRMRLDARVHPARKIAGSLNSARRRMWAAGFDRLVGKSRDLGNDAKSTGRTRTRLVSRRGETRRSFYFVNSRAIIARQYGAKVESKLVISNVFFRYDSLLKVAFANHRLAVLFLPPPECFVYTSSGSPHPRQGKSHARVRRPVAARPAN